MSLILKLYHRATCIRCLFRHSCYWSSIPDSNRHVQLGKLRCYHYTNTACLPRLSPGHQPTTLFTVLLSVSFPNRKYYSQTKNKKERNCKEYRKKQNTRKEKQRKEKQRKEKKKKGLRIYGLFTGFGGNVKNRTSVSIYKCLNNQVKTRLSPIELHSHIIAGNPANTASHY